MEGTEARAQEGERHALVIRAQAGEQEAFTTLVAQHQMAVFAVCLRYARNYADAEDLTQETLLKAHSHLHQLKDTKRFAPWLRQIAVNTCRNWTTRERPPPTLTLEAVEQTAVSENISEMDAQQVVQDALARLPLDLKRAIQGFYLEGFSQKEIALLWHLPESTVKGRLDAGRLRLRKEFQKMGLMPESLIESAVPTARIALTDADAQETRALRDALKTAGHSCSVIKKEDLLLSRLRRLHPDILILNTPFAQLDEYDILQALRIDQRLRGMAVMFLTPHKDEASIVKGWHSGVDCYLTKPFTVNEVVCFVGRLEACRRAHDYVGLAVEYAWRRQTESALRCLAEAVKLDEYLSATMIRSEAAFNYLRATQEFETLVAQLPSQEPSHAATPKSDVSDSEDSHTPGRDSSEA